MVIYECDGCGAQSTDGRQIKTVEIEIKSDQGQGHVEYHVCGHCMKRLVEWANPKKWPRSAVSA